MTYKINKLDLLFILYKIEDERQYNCTEISKKIDQLQNYLQNYLKKAKRPY